MRPFNRNAITVDGAPLPVPGNVVYVMAKYANDPSKVPAPKSDFVPLSTFFSFFLFGALFVPSKHSRLKQNKKAILSEISAVTIIVNR